MQIPTFEECVHRLSDNFTKRINEASEKNNALSERLRHYQDELHKTQVKAQALGNKYRGEIKALKATIEAQRDQIRQLGIELSLTKRQNIQLEKFLEKVTDGKNERVNQLDGNLPGDSVQDL